MITHRLHISGTYNQKKYIYILHLYKTELYPSSLPALGNCVIMKPSEVSEHTAHLLEDIIPLYFDKVSAYLFVNYKRTYSLELCRTDIFEQVMSICSAPVHDSLTFLICTAPFHDGLTFLVCTAPFHDGLTFLICTAPFHDGLTFLS